jgi:DNA-directed RNA polymerase I, II, and III subunit RPABC3
MSKTLLEDTIEIKKVNVDGRHFDRVSRIEGQGNVTIGSVELDVNTQIYPITEGGYYQFAIAASVGEEGGEDFDIFSYMKGEQTSQSSLIDQYEYVCHGKVF